jgi:hypothetical protein
LATTIERASPASAANGGAPVFSRSGIVTIAKGSKTATVTGVSLTGASLVLATVQARATQYVRSAVPDVTGSRFAIALNAAATSSLPVAWFVAT